MSAFEKTAKEHAVLSGLESYIEDTIEYSDTILSIHNYRYVLEHINDEVTDLETRITDIIEDSLQTRVDELKDYLEDLIKQELEK
jgi:predicted ester cyclase